MTEYTWIPIPKSEFKKYTDVARYRRELAAMYRKARKEDRKLAILLRDRINSAYNITKETLSNNIFNHGS